MEAEIILISHVIMEIRGISNAFKKMKIELIEKNTTIYNDNMSALAVMVRSIVGQNT